MLIIYPGMVNPLKAGHASGIVGIAVLLWLWGIACFQATAADAIKVAAIFGKTGDEQQYGLPGFQAIALAVEEINAQGGLLGRPVEVIKIDNHSTALDSRLAAVQAVKLGVTAVIGAAWSSNSLAMAPVLQQAGIPMISPISTNPQVTLVGDYIFRVCFTDPFQGKVMAQFARRDLRAQTAVILTNISSDYSLGLSQYFKEAFEQDGGAVLWEGKYLQTAIDFTEIVTRVAALQPEVVFSSGYERDSSLLLKQAINAGITATFLGGDGWSENMYTLVGNGINGNFFSNHWHREVTFPLSQRLRAKYAARYGEQPMTAAFPLAYDAMLLLADAIQRAQSLDRAQIRAALAATTGFQGATGTITFDAHGDPLNKEAVILKFERGQVVFVKTITP